jgi:aldehyde dehydrogenase (NAD+)
MRVAQEEIFGPVASVIEAPTLEDAIAVVNGVKYGLSSSIFTRDIGAAMRAIEEIRTGIVYVNHGTIGAEVHLPFGGTRQTGNGHREGGLQVLDIFTEWKAVYIDYSGRLQRAQIDRD